MLHTTIDHHDAMTAGEANVESGKTTVSLHHPCHRCFSCLIGDATLIVE
ncbi:MAG: hypothetical protein IID46_10090 [Planctomycetes bacterium]|nr:hypothetical protein [Planctomycetota bacterium]